MGKKRLDILLVECGLVESRSLAQRLIMAGRVRVNDQVSLKPALKILPNAELSIDEGLQYVSRGGVKLAAALDAFSINVSGLVCADVGSSTGGFTDCLLQRGASRVYAVDVGKGVLHWKIRRDPRVVVMEETNARYLKRLPQPVELVTVDASFISIKTLLPTIKKWHLPESSDTPLPSQGAGKNERMNREDQVIALIKPQFEAGRLEASCGRGVIRDPAVHRRVLIEVLEFARNEGYGLRGVIRSPLIGPKGNIEFLASLEFLKEMDHDISTLVDAVLETRNGLRIDQTASAGE